MTRSGNRKLLIRELLVENEVELYGCITVATSSKRDQ